MDPKQTAKNKLNAFYKAACELTAHWDECLDCGYPFSQSFNELVHRIGDWKDAVDEGWPVRAVLLSYEHTSGDHWEYILLFLQEQHILKAFCTTEIDNLNNFELQFKTNWGYLTLDNVNAAVSSAFHPIDNLSSLPKLVTTFMEAV